jgi:hypothetical protein
VKVRRTFGVQLTDELPESLLLFGGAAQLKQHVLHKKAFSNWAAIVLTVRLGTDVAGEGHQRSLLAFLGGRGARLQIRGELRAHRNGGEESCKYGQGQASGSEFSKHQSYLRFDNRVRSKQPLKKNISAVNEQP